MVLEKISVGQMGADMLTKNASVGVVLYNKKLPGMMRRFDYNYNFTFFVPHSLFGGCVECV